MNSQKSFVLSRSFKRASTRHINTPSKSKNKEQMLLEPEVNWEEKSFIRKNALEENEIPSWDNFSKTLQNKPDLNSILKAVEDLGSRFVKLNRIIEQLASYQESILSRMNHQKILIDTYKNNAEDLRSKVNRLIEHSDYYNSKGDFIQALKFMTGIDGNHINHQRKISSLLNKEDTKAEIEQYMNRLATNNFSADIDLRVEVMKENASSSSESKSNNHVPDESGMEEDAREKFILKRSLKPFQTNPFSSTKVIPKKFSVYTSPEMKDERKFKFEPDEEGGYLNKSEEESPRKRINSLLDPLPFQSKSVSRIQEDLSSIAPNMNLSGFRFGENPDSSNFYIASSDQFNNTDNTPRDSMQVKQENQKSIYSKYQINNNTDSDNKQSFAGRFVNKLSQMKDRPSINIVGNQGYSDMSENKRFIQTPEDSIDFTGPLRGKQKEKDKKKSKYG